MNIQYLRVGGDDFSAPSLSVYTEKSETKLYRAAEPAPGLFIAESPNVIIRALEAGYLPVSFLIEEHLLPACGSVIDLARRRSGAEDSVPVYIARHEDISRITGYPMTRGVLCAMRRKPLPEPVSLVRGARRIAILDNVENPTNIGAIFRSAAAMCIDAVLLAPGCSDPLYRRAVRVSMGTVFQVPWTFAGRAERDESGKPAFRKKQWPGEILEELRRDGFFTVALALSDNTVPVDDPTLKEKDRLAILLGSEGNGLPDETIACCDVSARIPMAHGVDSLNVAAAAAVAFWELRSRS